LEVQRKERAHHKTTLPCGSVAIFIGMLLWLPVTAARPFL
jgi:hypothetical protein